MEMPAQACCYVPKPWTALLSSGEPCRLSGSLFCSVWHRVPEFPSALQIIGVHYYQAFEIGIGRPARPLQIIEGIIIDRFALIGEGDLLLRVAHQPPEINALTDYYPPTTRRAAWPALHMKRLFSSWVYRKSRPT